VRWGRARLFSAHVTLLFGLPRQEAGDSLSFNAVCFYIHRRQANDKTLKAHQQLPITDFFDRLSLSLDTLYRGQCSSLKPSKAEEKTSVNQTSAWPPSSGAALRFGCRAHGRQSRAVLESNSQVSTCGWPCSNDVATVRRLNVANSSLRWRDTSYAETRRLAAFKFQNFQLLSWHSSTANRQLQETIDFSPKHDTFR
jgi:hypothetical protein